MELSECKMYLGTGAKVLNMEGDVVPLTVENLKWLVSDMAKLILRPLSDLVKDEYDFLYDQETDYESICDWIRLDAESRFTSKFSFDFWKLLFEYHFWLGDQGRFGQDVINFNKI